MKYKRKKLESSNLNLVLHVKLNQSIGLYLVTFLSAKFQNLCFNNNMEEIKIISFQIIWFENKNSDETY